ncbi:nucleoside triphosphate pyrophosphohydrolase [Deinococcus sp. KNUC1210]|uniref:nucleoside triphosphate pyrophosphohydrolase n=1 Tax=Deinococcus sp. KNUC1210 TaxID=2917691 RepID=UPI001EF11013|nr:nucleoside triphosphate pyrophosphohydrolase [Deinococcus sp. KNUC1210]ULH15562.1 nucleoside triphosphate pyrophosphohydrolase [Deinococcus sp. KNUC1210]
MPKLVRDRIPELFGGRVLAELSGEAHAESLRAKLQEEMGEFLQSGEPEELADVLEVLHALAALQGLTPAGLEHLRATTAAARGGFGRGLWWTP